jgi:hypothetical protein
MTTVDPRTTAIEALGYTAREAAFLACVSRHGGYFLRRQFVTATEAHHGRAVVRFTQRLLVARHATRQTFARRTHVYHLASQALYGGAPDVGPSQRRRRSALAIKVRLMTVDFALSRPDLQFLTSEAERLDYCDRLGIDRGRVPQQTIRPYRSPMSRPHAFPGPVVVGLHGADAAAAQVLVCAYIDDGAHSAAGFDTFLRQYARLLAVVPRWRVVYVAERQRQAAAASAVFARAFGADTGLATVRHVADVGEYFRLRRLYEREAWADLQTRGLDRYLDLQRRIGHDVDPLYARWEIEGDGVLTTASDTVGSPAEPRFEAVLLPYSYLAVDAVQARGRLTNLGVALS